MGLRRDIRRMVGMHAISVYILAISISGEASQITNIEQWPSYSTQAPCVRNILGTNCTTCANVQNELNCQNWYCVCTNSNFSTAIVIASSLALQSCTNSASISDMVDATSILSGFCSLLLLAPSPTLT